MVYTRVLMFCCLFFWGCYGSAQDAGLVNIGGPKYLIKTAQLPEEITSSRSAVVIEVPDSEGVFSVRGDWKKLAKEVHRNFRKIGIDAVTYIHIDDLNAGPQVKSAYLGILSSRKVKNLIFIRQEGEVPDERYSLKVAPIHESGEVLHGQLMWEEESPELDRLFLRLGRQVLRQETSRTNFLIPEKPEYLDDLSLFNGTRLENYPSRLKSLPVAIAAFQKISVDNVSHEKVREQIAAYNEQVDARNKELKEILALYPFKYELVDDVDDDALYQRGFQYVLMPVMSTGKAIKKVLNYQTTKSETDYMATVFDPEGKQKLIKVPVDANVCKYYIKQTIVKDIHTGDYWDPGNTWQEGLKNFILHLRLAFNLPIVE